MKSYNKKNIPLARKLRKEMTPWERKLWYEFLRTYPVRFQRQKAIGEYIVDFYCAKKQLVIELDGGGHYAPTQKQADALRTQQLEAMGLTVLRICNLDVDKNFTGVCEAIDMAVRTQSLPLTREVAAQRADGGREKSMENNGVSISPPVTACAVTAPSTEGAERAHPKPPSDEGGGCPKGRRRERKENVSSLSQSTPPPAPSDEWAMGGKTIYALGFFDGVHLGHQALLAACRHLAAETGAAAGAVTFANHPDLLLGRQTPLLCSLADRQRLLQHFGMEQLVTLPFDDSLRTMPWQDFLLMLREEYGAAGFVCGEDFRFGHRGEGSAQALEEACREAGIPCSVIPDQTLDGRRISSTHIRHLLEQGETAQAVRFLGHPHILTGQVVRGRGLGHTMGIPTANLLPEEGVLCPRHGVYACKARLEGQTFLAVANIGNRPTVGGHRVTAEAWLLDFTGDLYGRELTLELHRFLRPEQKFASLEELRAEIQRNRAETMEFFKNQ